MTHGNKKPRFSRENGVFCWAETGTVPSQDFLLKLVTGQKELCGDFQHSVYPVGKLQCFRHFLTGTYVALLG